MDEERIDWNRIVSDLYGGRHTPEEHIKDLRTRVNQLEKERRYFLEKVAELDAARRAPPAPAVVHLLGPLPTCPVCGAGAAWRSRRCCPLGTIVGQVEGQQVADILMQEDA